MNLNDLGNWCVVYLATGHGKPPSLTHAFFYHREHAADFMAARGGELYQKISDGTLKRA